MTRFFRTVYAASLASLLLTLVSTAAAGEHMPFSAFTCLLFGLLIALLPNVLQKWEDRGTLFLLLGAATAVFGFLPILLLRGPVFQYISYTLSVSSAAIFFVTFRHNTTYNNFKARFSFITVVVFCVLTYFILSTSWLVPSKDSVNSKPIMDSERVTLALNDIIPYAIVHLAAGILCLRGLRAQHGNADEKRFQRRQLRDALIFITVVSTVFIAAPYLKTIWNYLLHNVFAPFLRTIAMMIEDVVARAAEPGEMPTGSVPVPMEAPATAAPETAPLGTPSPVSGTMSADRVPPAAMKPDVVLRATLTFFIFAIIITIAAFILVKVLRRLRKNERSYPNESCEALPKTEEPKKETRSAKHSADPRKRMRYLYADFLRHLRRITAQRRITAPGANSQTPEDNNAEFWGESSNSGYNWMRAGMTRLPEHSASFSYMQLKEEGIERDSAATVMKWFDRRSKKRRTGVSAKRIFATSTCREIKCSAESLSRADEADLAAFTAYYEQARYHTNADPSPEDAARMAELFGRIKPEL